MTGSGLVIVAKPTGMTSHDVVARIRRLAGTRRVGHAGTLDPMATGVLVVGIGKATRLLGHLALTEKEYAATIRLGQATSTDDAQGELLPGPPASAGAGDETVRPAGRAAEACGAASASTGRTRLASDISEGELRAALTAFTGQITQVPPAVSAVKVGGRRAYQLARSGASPELAARTVTVRRLDLLAIRPAGELLDVDVAICCSSGTYIRAIARDLGAALGTGGHLTALSRTRVGPYLLRQARTLEQLAESFDAVPLAQAASKAFPRRELSAREAEVLSHGGRLAAADAGQAAVGGQPSATATAGGPVAAFGPDGTLIALVAEQDGYARPLAVFVP